jgi:hypothetical protein
MARRPTEWFGKALDLYDGVSASPSRDEIAAVADFASYTHPTITRVVGSLTWRLRSATDNAAEITSIWFGIGLFDEDVTPNPQTELDRHGWMFTGSLIMHQSKTTRSYWNGSTVVTEDFSTHGHRVQSFEIDIRAMRKVTPRGELILMTQWTAEAGSPLAPGVIANLRVLLKQ